MKLAILVLEDEPPVRAALARDLEPFAPWVRIEYAEDVADAREVVEEITADGDELALILADHRLPGESGVDFLVASRQVAATGDARRVLVTGQADQADTIRAINDGGLDHYIAKPWQASELADTVRTQLTNYVVSTGTDPLVALPVLQADRVMDVLRSRPDR